jgi:tetratricopeptide (TPR) repeat protein
MKSAKMKKELLFIAAALLACNTALWGQTPATAQNFAAQDFVNRGNMYAVEGDYDNAIADYTEAIHLDPNHVEAYMNRGFVYAFKNEYDRAIGDWETLLKIDPNNADAAENIELAMREKKLYGQTPVTAQDFYDRGFTFTETGDFDSAIADYNEAIRLDPNYADAYYNRGLIYFFRMDDPDRAITDFKAVLRIDPNNTLAILFLDAARQQRGY